MTKPNQGCAVFIVLVWFLASGLRAMASTPGFELRAVIIQNDIPLGSLINDPAWQQADRADITWNVDFRRPAENLTQVSLLFSQRFMYVLFVARQRQAVAATQTSDGSGVDSDDHVGLYVWPSGGNGFRYFFEANPLGARYRESSENQNFAPDWTAVGRRTSDGYGVAVRIPLKVLRGDGRATFPAWTQIDSIADR